MSKVDDRINKRLVSLICAISYDPKSWENWKCLDISLDAIDSDEENEVSLLCANSLIESYLRDQTFHVFVCLPHSLYVMCKNIDTSVLEEAGKFVIDMVKQENEQRIYCQVYSMDKDCDALISKIQEQGDAGPLTISARHHNNVTQFPASRDTKALLIEDDPVTRWMVRNTLKDECHLATASSASSAYAMYSAFRPDIVFLDIGLPDKNGNEVMEWILRNDPGARIVMFSSHDSLDMITQVLEMGAIGFVAKPFNRDSLLHYLRLSGKEQTPETLHEAGQRDFV